MAQNYYDVLGVSKTATTEEIKKGYREQAKKWHPDVNHDPGATERFRSVQEAYETLSDDGRRAAYNRDLEYGSNPYRRQAGYNPYARRQTAYNPYTRPWAAYGSPFQERGAREPEFRTYTWYTSAPRTYPAWSAETQRSRNARAGLGNLLLFLLIAAPVLLVGLLFLIAGFLFRYWYIALIAGAVISVVRRFRRGKTPPGVGGFF